MHFWRFGDAADHGVVLAGTYDWTLVVLSVLVASLAAFAALSVVQRVQAIQHERSRLIWLTVGSQAMGAGVWSMHFTAMLAFSLPVSVSYSIVGTLLSGLPAVLGSAAGLWIMIRRTSSWWHIQLGGLAVALGIGAMHYLGMEAMHAEAAMVYDPALFVLSIIVAHALATSALYVRFALGHRARLSRRVFAALIMGCAVSGMHYTAMAAVQFYAVDSHLLPTMILPPAVLAGIIIMTVSVFLGLTVVGTIVDERLAQANDSAARSGLRYRALIDAMADGLISVSEGGLVEQMNPAAERLFGISSSDAVGTPVASLLLLPIDELPASTESVIAPLARMGTFETLGHHRNGATFPVELKANRTSGDADVLFSMVLRDITERKAAEAELQRLVTAVEHAPAMILIADSEGLIRYVNPAFEVTTGFERWEVIGRSPESLRTGLYDEGLTSDIWEEIMSGKTWTGTLPLRRKDGKLCELETSISPIRDVTGAITNFVEVSRDVSEQRLLEDELAQARKLESIGQLAAGIAHEINTPTQYVADNTRFLRDAFSSLDTLTRAFIELLPACRRAGVPEHQIVDLERAIEDADLDYLIEETPRAIGQSLEGLDHVAKIVSAMKEFSHPSVEKTPTDLNRAIQSTITVATNEWKYVAEMETDFDPGLPIIPCVPGEFNQVILNMIVNAAHAIAEKQGLAGGERGRISVSTRLVDDEAEIVIEDNGTGIPEDIVGRIFDPFFTTKQVGKGTGQGLCIAHNAIVKRLGGTLSVESQIGIGTRFIIRLPVAERTIEVAAA